MLSRKSVEKFLYPYTTVEAYLKKLHKPFKYFFIVILAQPSIDINSILK